MSDDPTWLGICATEESAPIDVGQLCASASPIDSSAIDALYDDIAEIVQLGGPSELGDSPALGRLMILGLVASTESYFRSVLASLVWICPLARERVSDLTIRFGAMDYYRTDEMALSLMEQHSLASGTEITKRLDKVLGERPAAGSSLEVAIGQFDQVCKLRHAAVHTRGSIASHSAKDLGLDTTSHAVMTVTFSGIQQVAAVCVSVARAFNRFVFEVTVRQWLIDGILRRSWDLDKERFAALFESLHSQKDDSGPTNAYNSWRSVMAWRSATGIGKAPGVVQGEHGS